MPQTVMIAGATGLIGSALRRVFTQAGDDVRPVDLRAERQFDSADIVIHAAGYGQPDKFLADEVATIRCNIEDTRVLLDCVKPGGKFLFLSTSEVYSGLERIPHAEDDIGATTPAHPRAAYIDSKRCGEVMVHAARRQGVDAKIARACLIYGPGTRADDGRVLNVMMRDAIVKREVRLLDNGMAMRPYLYIDEAVTMFMNIALRGTQAVYNVGSQTTGTVRDAALAIGRIEDVPVHFCDGPPLPGSPLNVCVSTARYEQEFGRVEPTPLEDGIRRILAWQRENLYGENARIEHIDQTVPPSAVEPPDWRRARGLR